MAGRSAWFAGAAGAPAFVAGTGGAETGLAFRILEAGYRLQIPRLFAALVLLGLAGIIIYVALDHTTVARFVEY